MSNNYRWHSVAISLPNKAGKYLCSTYTDVVIMEFRNGKFRGEHQPIAWRLLPMPYINQADKQYARNKAWKEKHPDYSHEYYERNKERINERTWQYLQDHAEEHRAYAREYYRKNRERISERERERYRRKKLEGMKDAEKV